MLIEIENASKQYNMGEESIFAMHDISFGVEQGEFVAIVGCSGSGKSTLMNVLGCLDTLTEGEYYLNGENVKNLSENALSKIRSNTIGFIFQSFNLIPSLTALENVELPLQYKRIPRTQRYTMAIDALKQVGLENRQNHMPSQLSGGQQQRVAIARATAFSPPIILADEPTGNLDSNSGKEIMGILKKLNSDGKTILLITHDDNIASQARRTLRLSDGRLVSKGSSTRH